MKKFIAAVLVAVLALAFAGVASAAWEYNLTLQIYFGAKDYSSSTFDYEETYVDKENSYTDIINYFHDTHDIYVGIINKDESSNIQVINKEVSTFTHYVNYDTPARNGIVDFYSVLTVLTDKMVENEDTTPAMFFFADIHKTQTICFYCTDWTEDDIKNYNNTHEVSFAMNKEDMIAMINYAFTQN